MFLFPLLFLCVHSHLTIIGPSSLVNRFSNKGIEISYSKIGMQTDFYVRGQLFFDTTTSSKDACSPLNGLQLGKNNTSPYDESYKILLAYKGTCSLTQKARNAQNAGASMLIVINTGTIELSNVIFSSDAHDIYIPIAMIDNQEGKIIEDYMISNPSEKIIAEVNFTPKKDKKGVDFKLFFSSSEPRAYLLINQFTKYIDKFGEQVNFEPVYVVHQNPYYVEENPKSNPNCLSRGVYCYFPKETTITKEGQNILMEDIRQKCLFKLGNEQENKLYYEYMNIFYAECIENQKNSLTEACSKSALKKLGYPETFLDKCIADSFGVDTLSHDSYKEKENKILKNEYNEILKYQLTSFPALAINTNIVYDIIKEDTLVINLCNSVEEKPDFCPFFTGFTDIHRKSARRRNKIIYFLIILVIVINVLLFFMCKAYIIEKINSRVTSGNIDIDGRINNVIKNYFSLKNSSNDYKAFDDKKGSSPQVIEMHEGSVNTV